MSALLCNNAPESRIGNIRHRRHNEKRFWEFMPEVFHAASILRKRKAGVKTPAQRTSCCTCNLQQRSPFFRIGRSIEPLVQDAEKFDCPRPISIKRSYIVLFSEFFEQTLNMQRN